MNKYVMIAALVLLTYACNRPVGELTGYPSSSKVNFTDTKPYGMQFIRKGTFLMGAHVPNDMFPGRDITRRVTVESFFIDETEITNHQYKQFIYWVRDSIAYRELINIGREEYMIQDPNDESDSIRIRWTQRIRWNDRNEDIQEALSSLFYQGHDDLGTRQLNPQRLIYTYEIFNDDQVSLPRNKYNYATRSYQEGAYVKIDSTFFDDNGHLVTQTVNRPLRHRKDFYSSRMLYIYPDTLTWTRDIRLSYNDPKMKMYFSDKNYSNYPVVGVTWEQATAFCHWRTKIYNDTHKVKTEAYRLPSEAEWEFAAKGRDKDAIYPWKGTSLVDEKKGCYLANFKQTRGNYVSDAGVTTKPVRSYNTAPNANGLYDMAGNVAEWTATAYFGTTNMATADLNPNFEYNARAEDPINMKRKVVKGGSWKDIPYYLQSGTRTYEYQNVSRPYIGFRCVRSFKGDI